MRTKKTDKKISDKIRLLLKEGKSRDQAIAIALSMYGKKRTKK